jgi:hypothetical protein
LESIIDRFLEFLPAPDVSFRRLHGRVTEKKLNLFEFASSAMAKASIRAAAQSAPRLFCRAVPYGMEFSRFWA